MDIKDFVFIGTTCTQDFLNGMYGLKKTMFSSTGMLLEDFLFYIENRDKFKYEMEKWGLRKDARIFGRYFWEEWNSRNGVDSNKVFFVEYGFEGLERKIQVLYRHYEFNVLNYFKVRKRVLRCKQDTRTPFFVVQTGDGVEPDFKNLVDRFLAIPYEYKLLVVNDKQYPELEESKYVVRSNLIHEPLMPILDAHLRKYYPEIIFSQNKG